MTEPAAATVIPPTGFVAAALREYQPLGAAAPAFPTPIARSLPLLN